MKLASLWLLPAIALTSIGSLTHATSRPSHEDGGPKKGDNKVVSSVVKFDHDADIDAYLTSIRSFMLTPPRDGRFGASRVPTFHGEHIGKIPGYKEINQLKDVMMVNSFVAGAMSGEMLKNWKDYKTANPNQNIEIPEYRITRVHTVQGSEPQLQVTPNLQKEILAAVSQTKKLVNEKGYDTYSNSITVNGAKGWIMSKAVRAFDKSCYSCHSDIKEGQPIGHVIATVLKASASK